MRRALAASLLAMAFLVTVPTWAGRYAVISGFASTTLAASPAPTEVVGGDPRSPQEGPGLVGNPGGAILVVVAIALLAIVGTTVYVRLTGGPRRGS